MLSRLSARIVLRPISLSSTVYKKKYCTEAVTPKIDSLVNGEKSGNDTSFATLLRNSTFVQMGNPIGKVSSLFLAYVQAIYISNERVTSQGQLQRLELTVHSIYPITLKKSISTKNL